MLLLDHFSIEEEFSSLRALEEEISGKIRDPSEDVLSSLCFQDKQGNSLLGEQADDDGGPSMGVNIPVKKFL